MKTWLLSTASIAVFFSFLREHPAFLKNVPRLPHTLCGYAAGRGTDEILGINTLIRYLAFLLHSMFFVSQTYNFTAVLKNVL